MATEPRRMTAEEKDTLLAAYHPDYKEDGFVTLKVGPNKGEKVPTELGRLLESNSRILNEKIDLNKIDYDVDVLIIGAGGAGSSAAIEAHEAGANVMIVTKLRIGDANTMMAEGGIQCGGQRERLSGTALPGRVRRRTFCGTSGTAEEAGHGGAGRHPLAGESGRYV